MSLVMVGDVMQEKKRKPINIQIGANIRKYREFNGFSREILAEKLGISPRFVANIEVGAVGVSLSTLKRTCEVLGISADRLLWDDEADLGLDERIKHLPKEYVEYLHRSVLAQIELIEHFIAEKQGKQQ